MNKNNIYIQEQRGDCIFLPSHPDADSQGFINIHNRNLLHEIAESIMNERKSFHESELKGKRKSRTLKF